jgi:hypothetical protein
LKSSAQQDRDQDQGTLQSTDKDQVKYQDQVMYQQQDQV